MNAEQTNFALLGALVAVAVVLLVIVAFGGYLVLRGVGYMARFKGLQANRKDGAMTFGGIVDETSVPAQPSRWRFWPAPEAKLVTDAKGEPVPARELN